MSHIPGHWDDNNGTATVGAASAHNHFGRLRICETDKAVSLKTPLVNFPFLFINNRYYSQQKDANDGPIDEPIGCHIQLIPFEIQGESPVFIPFATDIVSYADHQQAESAFMDFINEDNAFLGKRGIDPSDVKHIKSQHGIPGLNYTKNHQAKIETFAPELIDQVVARLERLNLKELKDLTDEEKAKHPKHLKILKQTSEYLKTPSFKTIYAGGNAINWIQEAIADNMLMPMDLFVKYKPK